MDAFLENMLTGPRKIAVTGHFGSGKTEFAVSLAFALAEVSRGALAVADLDIENPYFRSRERQDELDRVGVKVYSDPYWGRNGSELQVISAAIRAPLEDPNCRVICDAGGDASGAMVLNQFKKYFTEDFRMLCVVNPNRPGTDTVEKAVAHLRAIEAATGLRVTELVANGHLIRSTTAREVAEGWRFAREVGEKTGLEVLCACCMRELCGEARALGVPVFPIGMYMRESYLDKPV